MKTILTIVAAFSFVAMFALCELSIGLALLAAAVFFGCAKIIEKHYLTKEEKNERV